MITIFPDDLYKFGFNLHQLCSCDLTALFVLLSGYLDCSNLSGTDQSKKLQPVKILQTFVSASFCITIVL